MTIKSEYSDYINELNRGNDMSAHEHPEFVRKESIDKSRNDFKDFFRFRQALETNGNFFAIYEDFYGSSLGIESVFDSLEAVRVNPDDRGCVFGHTSLRIPLLCDKLIKVGNIYPILFLVVHTHTYSKDKYFYYRLLSLLRNHTKERVNGKNIADICSDFIMWISSEYPDEDFSDNHYFSPLQLSCEFICREILGIGTSSLCFESPRETDVILPEDMAGYKRDFTFSLSIDSNNIDQLIQEKIINKYLNNNIAVVGWLLPVCFWLNQTGLAYVSQKYIIPYIDKHTFRGSVVEYRIVRAWLDSCLEFSNNLMYFRPDNVKELYGKDAVLFDDKLHLVLDKPFPEVFKTPCKGFGKALYTFLNSGRTDIISNADEKAQQKAEDKHGLFNYLKENYEAEYESLIMLSVLFLFADDEVDTGVAFLIRHYDLLSGTKQFVNPKIALIKAFFTVEELYTKSELYNLIQREVIRSLIKYENSHNADRRYSDDLLHDIEVEMQTCVLKNAHKLLKKINTKVAWLNEALSKEEKGLLLPEDIVILRAEEDKLAELVDKLGDAAAVFNIKPAFMYDRMLKKSIEGFFSHFNITDTDTPMDEIIYKPLSPKATSRVKSLLRQSELMMDFHTKLKDIAWQEEIDYSGPILYMTKALEYIGNLFFKALTNGKPTSDVRGRTNFNARCYISGNGNGNRWLDHIALGNIAHIFEKPTRQIHNSAFFAGTTDIHNLINEDRVKALENKVAYIDENGNEVIFTADTNDNLNIIFKALLYIADKFRNKAAHGSRTAEESYKECKGLLISSQHLLWVLLYIIKDGITLAENNTN